MMDQILGEWRTASGLQWLVKWRDLPDDRATWEPWTVIKDGNGIDLIKDFRADCNTRAGSRPLYTDEEVQGRDLELLGEGGV